MPTLPVGWRCIIISNKWLHLTYEASTLLEYLTFCQDREALGWYNADREYVLKQVSRLRLHNLDPHQDDALERLIHLMAFDIYKIVKEYLPNFIDYTFYRYRHIDGHYFSLVINIKV